MGSAKDHVLTSQGREVGRLKSVDEDLVHLQGKDYWLPVTAIEAIEDDAVRLRPDWDYLGGPPPKGKARGLMSGATRLALLGLIARTAYRYRDEGKRKQLVDKAKELTERAKAEMNKAKMEIEKARSKQEKEMGSSMTDIPAFSTLDLSNRTVGVTELEVIAEVTRAFPENTVRTEAIGVHKADGHEVGTLRFSVDERASSDIELSRLESAGASAEVMAQEVIADLRAQIPSAM